MEYTLQNFDKIIMPVLRRDLKGACTFGVSFVRSNKQAITSAGKISSLTIVLGYTCLKYNL